MGNVLGVFLRRQVQLRRGLRQICLPGGADGISLVLVCSQDAGYQSVRQVHDTSLPFDVKGELLASINALHVEQLKEWAAECHLPQALLT